MKSLAVAGGLYRETCAWPTWDHLYGSGGRAAVALGGGAVPVEFHTYASEDAAKTFAAYAQVYGVSVRRHATEQTVAFDYVHTLSPPVIKPIPLRITRHEPFDVEAECILRFGMMEGSARVVAERCVYDPQSAFSPEAFEANGSKAVRLAIVGNAGEIRTLGGSPDVDEAAAVLLGKGAELVIAKDGPRGATLFRKQGAVSIPAFLSDAVWTLGSGDVFAAAFTAGWAVEGLDAADAARAASVAVSDYASSMSLPMRDVAVLAAEVRTEVGTIAGEVYLAGPFFDMAQLWLVDEARRCLSQAGLNVFSPLHDVGHGAASEVVQKDIDAISRCDLVFALLNGIDAGTLFEVGYARALGKPVYALAQSVPSEDLKMLEGSGCLIFSDFVTAVHHAAWRR
jgi:hypothetical protein